MKGSLSRRELGSAIATVLGLVGSFLGFSEGAAAAATGGGDGNDTGCERHVCPCGRYCITTYSTDLAYRLDPWGKVTTYVYSADGELLAGPGGETAVCPTR